MLYEIDICDPVKREVLHTVCKTGGDPLQVLATSTREAVSRYAQGIGYGVQLDGSFKQYPWHLKARAITEH